MCHLGMSPGLALCLNVLTFPPLLYSNVQRGVGDKAIGTSISLVAPAEEKEHMKICEAVRGNGSRSLETVHVDGRLLSEAQARVSLATKIVACNDVESQVSQRIKGVTAIDCIARCCASN